MFIFSLKKGKCPSVTHNDQWCYILLLELLLYSNGYLQETRHLDSFLLISIGTYYEETKSSDEIEEDILRNE